MTKFFFFIFTVLIFKIRFLSASALPSPEEIEAFINSRSPSYALIRGDYDPPLPEAEARGHLQNAIQKEINNQILEAEAEYIRLARHKYTPATLKLGNLYLKKELFNPSIHWFLLAIHQYWEDNGTHYKAAVDLIKKIEAPIVKAFIENFDNLYPLDQNIRVRIKKSFTAYMQMIEHVDKSEHLSLILERLYLFLEKNPSPHEKIRIKRNKEVTDINRSYVRSIKPMQLIIGNDYMTGKIGTDLRQDERDQRAIKYFKKVNTPESNYYTGLILFNQYADQQELSSARCDEVRNLMLHHNSAEAKRNIGLVYIYEAASDPQNKEELFANAHKHLTMAIIMGDLEAKSITENFLDFIAEASEEVSAFEHDILPPVNPEQDILPIKRFTENENPKPVFKDNSAGTFSPSNETMGELKVKNDDSIAQETKGVESCILDEQRLWHKKNKEEKHKRRIHAFLISLKNSFKPADPRISLNQASASLDPKEYKIQFDSPKVESTFHSVMEDRLKGKKLQELMDEIMYSPWSTIGSGKPEVLKDSGGILSRRINHKDRITYQVSKGNITIHSCEGHYYK